MSLYNLLNGVQPEAFLFLPMLGHHPDYYPRFRDCFVNKENQIVVFTRVGGGNRKAGFGEEKLYNDPHFVKTYDDDFDGTYGYYVFNVPDEWKEDFDHIMKGEKFSEAYLEQMIKVYPKLEDKFRTMYVNYSTASPSSSNVGPDICD